VLDPAEVDRFKAEEEAKGNVVTDTGHGTFMVTPRSPPPKKDAAP
jgi:hypothetical protein